MVKLGYCPYCNLDNYSRDTEDYQDNYVKMVCFCNDCKETFNEYFQLDEVTFNKNGEEFICSNTISNEEKEVLLRALKLLIEKDGGDYKELIKILEGGLRVEN